MIYGVQKQERMGQICEVIKYEGDNSTFVWKHPAEDFNSMTQLIVHGNIKRLIRANTKGR